MLIVGGTFDPPHSAHIGLPVQLRDRWFQEAAILFVPAAASPFKSARDAASPADRVRMTRLAISHIPGTAVWTDEIDRDRGEPSYTVDTLRRAAEIAPLSRLRLVIGADQAAAFHRWRECREILRLAEPVVMLRPPLDSTEVLRAALEASGDWSGQEVEQWLSRTVATPLVDVSSTRIRVLVHDGGVDAVPEDWLHPAVREYIRDHGLYRA
ncbi:MAG: nicotinate (nicotinamide) nucleotide adenylyltransferase [Phycisphaerales bacterium]